MTTPLIKLANGQPIPQIGLGLWQIKDHDEFITAIKTAIDVGYRHFDTAQAYGNEQLLGEAWRSSGLSREKLFMTTKIAVTHFGYNKALSSFNDSLQRLQTDYVDLLLLHFPLTLLRKKTWQALEAILGSGGAKSIGVSNYTIRHLEEMKGYAQVMPLVNQVELHVFLQQPELVKYCRDSNIVVEAYSPLAHARAMADPAILAIARKHGKTYAQIMLRWCIQQQLVVLPKSANPSRIKENFEIFDFQLDKQDLAALLSVERGLRTAWSPVHVP